MAEEILSVVAVLSVLGSYLTQDNYLGDPQTIDLSLTQDNCLGDPQTINLSTLFPLHVCL